MADFIVQWRDQEIGLLKNYTNDMLFFEGEWEPRDAAQAIVFTDLIISFDVRLSMKDPSKATRILLQSTDNKETVIHALVLGLVEGRLLLKCVFNAKAVDWLTTHVY